MSLKKAMPILLVAAGVGATLLVQKLLDGDGSDPDALFSAQCKKALGRGATLDGMEKCLPKARACDAKFQRKEENDRGRFILDCLKRDLETADSAEGDSPVKPVYPTKVGEVPPAVKQLCDALHDLPKRRKAECCGQKPGVILTSECERNLAGATADGSVTLDPAAVAACEAAMTAAYQGCDWVGPYDVAVPAACLGIVVGTKKSGAVCRSTLECEGQMLCRGAGPTDTGKCGAPSPPGGLCNTAVDPLAVYTRQKDTPPCSGGYCDRNRCVAQRPEGAKCNANVHCAVGRCAAGKCVAQAVAQVSEPCLGDDCAAGLRCIEGTCVAPKPLGESCAKTQECRAACIDGKCQLGCLSPGQLLNRK